MKHENSSKPNVRKIRGTCDFSELRKLQMLLSPRKNGLDSLFKEVQGDTIAEGYHIHFSELSCGAAQVSLRYRFGRGGGGEIAPQALMLKGRGTAPNLFTLIGTGQMGSCANGVGRI